MIVLEGHMKINEKRFFVHQDFMENYLWGSSTNTFEIVTHLKINFFKEKNKYFFVYCTNMVNEQQLVYNM